MCLWCNDEAGTEPALSVVVYYCCQWKRNLNLAAQPAVNQYFTGSVLWRDDTKTDLKEERWGEGRKEKKRRIYLDIRWHTFSPKVTENKHQALMLRLSHNRTLQLLQEHLFPGCLLCYFSAANRIKPRSNQLSRDRICTLGWVQRQRTKTYPLEGTRARISVQQRTREGSDVLWCSSLCLFLLLSSSSWQSLFIYFTFFLLFKLIWLSNF